MAWRKTYSFGTEGKGLCARNEDFTQGKFHHPVHSKDEYLTADYKDPRARRVLEFLIPIMLPDKGVRVTVGVASTILGYFGGQRAVDWGLVFADQVKRMVSGIGDTKPTSLSPFLLYLYKAMEYLDEEEVRYYKAAQVEEAYGFEGSDEETKEDGMKGTGAAGACPLERAPPE